MTEGHDDVSAQRLRFRARHGRVLGVAGRIQRRDRPVRDQRRHAARRVPPARQQQRVHQRRSRLLDFLRQVRILRCPKLMAFSAFQWFFFVLPDAKARRVSLPGIHVVANSGRVARDGAPADAADG